MNGRTLADTFRYLEREEPDRTALYTVLAPIYEAIYATDDRIDGQFETVATTAPPDATTVLEVGCGTGALLARLEAAFEQTVGADVSPQMARRARNRARTEVVVGSVSALRPRSVDLITMMGAVLGHVRPDTNARALVSDAYERLRPGGRIVCSVHDRAALADLVSRELTAETSGYRVLQRDRQHPTGGGMFNWNVEYTLTERESGRSVSVEQQVPIRAFGREELADWFRTAGFQDVETSDREFVAEERRSRAFVITASTMG